MMDFDISTHLYLYLSVCERTPIIRRHLNDVIRVTQQHALNNRSPIQQHF